MTSIVSKSDVRVVSEALGDLKEGFDPTKALGAVLRAMTEAGEAPTGEEKAFLQELFQSASTGTARGWQLLVDEAEMKSLLANHGSVLSLCGGEGYASALNQWLNTDFIVAPDPAARALYDAWGRVSCGAPGSYRWLQTPSVDALAAQPDALPLEVIQHLDAKGWGIQHLGWHTIRAVDEYNLDLLNGHPEWAAIEKANEFPSLEQPGAGLDFLAMHWHMRQHLLARFPQHKQQFEGWTRDEIAKAIETGSLDGIELEEGMRRALEVLNNIAQYAKHFPDSDSLGRFIESPYEGYEDPEWPESLGSTGIHSDIHVLFAEKDQSLIGMMDFKTNLMSRTFWKLHGFIDRVWGEYLAAKGQSVPHSELHEQMELMRRLTSLDHPLDAPFEEAFEAE
jgi:hypothetical protein